MHRKLPRFHPNANKTEIIYSDNEKTDMSEYRVQKLYYYYYRHHYYYYYVYVIYVRPFAITSALLIGHCNSSLLEIVMSRDVTTHNEKLASRNIAGKIYCCATK